MKKRYLKLTISCCFLVKHWVHSQLAMLVGKSLPGRCVVLCYHSVKPEGVEKFKQQMKIIKKYALPLPSDFIGELQCDKKYVVMTFDDGFQNVITNALPILLEYRIPATLFLVSKYLGSTPDWIDEKNHSDLKERIINIEKLKSINNNLVSFGSHSSSHPYMTKLAETKARKELTESKNTLESILGYEIRMFAFPHGDYNNALVSWAKETGYNRVFTLSHAMAFSSADEFVTGRIDVYMDDSLLEFKLKLLGAYCWLNQAFHLKRSITKLFFRKFKSRQAN